MEKSKNNIKSMRKIQLFIGSTYVKSFSQKKPILFYFLGTNFNFKSKKPLQ